MLDRKLLRDVWAWRAQLAAIVLIIACGIATYVAMQSVYESLRFTQRQYYEQYRFSHVFASLTRAPESVARRLAEIDGVASVQTRVVQDATIDLPGREDPVTARLISLPEGGRPSLNDVYLRTGRYIAGAGSSEAIVSEAFANANGLRIGDRIAAVINRRLHRFLIVGIGLSPEYVYEIRGAADIWPDNRHFGILWAGRKTLAAAFDLTGSFNNVSIAMAPHANEPAVLAGVDRVLDRYGSLGAIAARDQPSNRFLSDELTQLRVQSIFIPVIFLSIAAFLLNVALSRLVATQREQIAILKALGIGNAAIALHYAKAVALLIAAGAGAGTALGAWLGWRLTLIYTQFFHFPVLHYELSARVVLTAVSITGIAAAGGALQAVRGAVLLAPAIAMRPASPPSFRATLAERFGLANYLPLGLRMALRNIERKPAASAVTALAVAFAAAMLVVGRYGNDAVHYMIDLQFRTVEREDVTVFFTRPLSNRVRYELTALPGVREVEPFRALDVRMAVGHRSRRVVILGLPPDGGLYRIVDRNLRRQAVPPHGVMLSKQLAKLIGTHVGGDVDVRALEERRVERRVRVAAVVDDILGLNAYMDEGALHRLAGEHATVSGAYLSIDSAQTAAFDRAIKRTPAVAGVAYRESTLRQFERTIAESMGISIAFLIGFASAIACGVIFNAGRVALAERGRDVSTLRILGFTRTEVGLIFLGEEALIVAASLPAGCILGYALCRALAPLYETDVYRMPVVVNLSTYIFAIGVTLAAALVSALLVRRGLDTLDLLAVLKEAG